MSEKVFKLLLVVGVLLSFTGLLVLPSALSSATRDQALLGAGLAFFGLGALLVGLSLYFQARALRASIQADPNMLSILNAKRKNTCDSCGTAASLIQCTMHRVSLCATCLVRHYDPRGCVYVPAARKSNRASRAAAASRA